jgi:hypothetical protein
LKKCEAATESQDEFEVLRLVSLKPGKNQRYEELIVRCPKQSVHDMTAIKSYLDEYNRPNKEMGRPLSISTHVAARLSPFSHNSEMINLRGLIVILSLLLISSSAEKMIRVFSHEGWTLWINMIGYMKDPGTIWNDIVMFSGGSV